MDCPGELRLMVGGSYGKATLHPGIMQDVWCTRCKYESRPRQMYNIPSLEEILYFTDASRFCLCLYLHTGSRLHKTSTPMVVIPAVEHRIWTCRTARKFRKAVCRTGIIVSLSHSKNYYLLSRKSHDLQLLVQTVERPSNTEQPHVINARFAKSFSLLQLQFDESAKAYLQWGQHLGL